MLQHYKHEERNVFFESFSSVGMRLTNFIVLNCKAATILSDLKGNCAMKGKCLEEVGHLRARAI